MMMIGLNLVYLMLYVYIKEEVHEKSIRSRWENLIDMVLSVEKFKIYEVLMDSF